MAELNNYEKTQKRAEKEFLGYDQEKMIEKCGLDADDAYLYITFFHQPYRIDRHSGQIARLCPDGSVVKAGYDEAMTIFDILCAIKPGRYLAGVWVGIEKFSNTPFDGTALYQPYAKDFDGKTKALQGACEKFGGCPCEVKGDVAYRFAVFDFFPVIFRFWNGDEELLPTLRFLWDVHTPDYIRFETMFYVMSHILKTLAIAITK